MESSKKESSKMALHIDLNEAPLSSPRELTSDAIGANFFICSVCRKPVTGGKRAEVATEEQRKAFKCFRCLLRPDGGRVGRFDINASPPREAEGDDVAVAGNGGGGKIGESTHFSFYSQHPITRQLNPLMADTVYNLPKPSSIPTRSISSGLQGMLQQKLHLDGSFDTVCKDSTFDGAPQPSHFVATKCPESPDMVYLQTLKEYIAEKKGVLGEGWHVEFEFCDRRYKTSAVYVAPDRSRLKSREDVAHHLGLSLSSHYIKTGIGSSGFTFLQNGLTIGPAKKESPAPLTAQNCSQRQIGMNIYCSSENDSHVDSVHDGFPIQFQNFCLISAGSIDPRPSYHSTSQIWPVGYKCSWHDKITGSLFVCDVADGGDSGPIFKVQRYPCNMHPVPVGSTILSRMKMVSGQRDNKVGKDDLATLQVVDDDSISIINLLNEDSPPCLDHCISTSTREDECDPEEDNSSNLDLDHLPQRTEYLVDGAGILNDIIGEFQVEGRSTSTVWEKVSQTLIYACFETFKQKGALKFFCNHDIYGMDYENLKNNDSLSRFCHFGGPIGIPALVQNENQFKITCEMLLTWLQQDRFGLDTDFVLEIVEQLPGLAACSGYKSLNDRKPSAGLQTVGSGFFHVERKTTNAFGTSTRAQLRSADKENILKRDPCPPGKPLSSKLPLHLLGDVLQVWELGWRFLEVLGLGRPFSFQELESELVSPWLGSFPMDCVLDTEGIGDATLFKAEKVSQDRVACLGQCTGLLLAKILRSLLKLLVSELLTKVAVHVCPNLGAEEFKLRRGRKKDLDRLAALKKIKLDMLPINELTWHEISRRYLLAVLSMEGNHDSTEIASHESWKVFHCLRGDGGILCGSLTGVAALEADAVILADAMKEIYGSLKNKNEIVSIYERETDANIAQAFEVVDGVIPEWAQVLEPVKKLPTNVGARIRRCINEALERNPPDWAKKILEHSISKEVYKGNASGPTKRAVISLLTNVSCEHPQPKAEKKGVVKIKTNLGDLISKQCRIVLRCAAAADEDRVFCNLLGRADLNPNDNEDEGLLGYPAMVSRPLDFRTIDLRLAAGVYGESHEAFIEDVREVWCNIRTAYGDRSDLIDMAEKLSQKFEDLYEKEVLTLVHKLTEFPNDDGSSSEAVRERDDLLARISKSSLPRAPWEEGICKVCGMDKDDDNVLLCDKCDSEYHRYCLNPPLLRIPEGNWYCPSCVAGKSIFGTAAYGAVANQRGKKRYQGGFTLKFLEVLARLANLMEIKEYSEFTVEEKIFFMKFLFDEALNSVTIRDHMEQCASRAADLQHKLRPLISELKILKFKEEMLGLSAEKASSGVYNKRGDLKSDASSSLLAFENSSRGKPSEKGTLLPFISGCSTKLEDSSCLNDKRDYNKQPCWLPSMTNRSTNAIEMLSQSQHQHLVRDHSQQENISTHTQLSRGSGWRNELPVTIDQKKKDERHPSILKDLRGPFQSTSQMMPDHNFSGSICNRVTEHAPPAPVITIHESRGHHSSDQADMTSLQDDSLKMATIKNDISEVQNSIASIESELVQISLRKDFLGRDCNGRVYWAFHSRGARSWIIANGTLTSKERDPEDFIGIPDSDKWVSYESDNEIEELIGWLRENSTREKELKESILQFQSCKLRDPEYTETHILSRGNSNHLASFSDRGALLADLTTKAMTSLEKKNGPCLRAEAADVHQTLASRAIQDRRMYRCVCLELLWPSKDHCRSCHQSFPNSEQLRQHSMVCRTAASTSKRSHPAEDSSKRKKSRIAAAQEKHPGSIGILQMSTSDKQKDGSSIVEGYLEPGCPYNFEEITTRFIVPNSLKDVVNEIGLVASGGIPSFLPSGLPNPNDSALILGPTTINDTILGEISTDLRGQQQQSSNEAGATDIMKDNKESNRVPGCAENGLDGKGTNIDKLKSTLMRERDQVVSLGDKSSIPWLSKSSIIRESSSRPLVGRASEVLRFLKMNLLDMDAALPDDAVRLSRSHQDRRCAWRAFVKSARSIHEMVQATIILEDTIKSENLQSGWWYWSSPSTAAKISTIPALALRIYALDAAIIYEKTPPNEPKESLEPSCALNEEAPHNSSPPVQKTPEAGTDPGENSRTRSKTSKRRRDLKD